MQKTCWNIDEKKYFNTNGLLLSLYVDATTLNMVTFIIVLGCHLIASKNLSPESKPVEILSRKW